MDRAALRGAKQHGERILLRPYPLHPLLPATSHWTHKMLTVIVMAHASGMGWQCETRLFPRRGEVAP